MEGWDLGLEVPGSHPAFRFSSRCSPNGRRIWAHDSRDVIRLATGSTTLTDSPADRKNAYTAQPKHWPQHAFKAIRGAGL